jgi:1,4-dihydroxy-2-naphthoate polyprenyltransferase
VALAGLVEDGGGRQPIEERPERRPRQATVERERSITGVPHTLESIDEGRARGKGESDQGGHRHSVGLQAVTDLKTWVAGARPRTLPAALVPVLVGTACAAGVGPGSGPLPATDALRGLSPARFAAVLVVVLALQVGTNYANDYSDGRRGTDDPGQRVGPPRLVGWGLAPAQHVKAAALAAFGVAAAAGLYLAASVSWWLVAVGAVSIAAGWLYTGGPRPYGYAGLGEVFVFVFFGLVATVGAAYVQTGHLVGRPERWRPASSEAGTGELALAYAEPVPVWTQLYPWVTLGAAVAVGCLATALLVINNLRDIPSDREVGKRTLAVILGDGRTRVLYVALMVIPFLIVPVVAGLGGRPLGAAALFVVVLANRPVLRVLQGASGPDLVPVLGLTGQVQLAFGVLFAGGLILSAA